MREKGRDDTRSRRWRWNESPRTPTLEHEALKTRRRKIPDSERLKLIFWVATGALRHNTA